jgi:hypothetical protein
MSTFDMRMADFSNANYDKYSYKASQTDLEKLTKLLDSFGVPYSVEGSSESDPMTSVTVGDDGDYYHAKGVVKGFPGFYTAYQFDSNGEFISMGAWE